jgi:C4-dicarboxylate-specific signal transduction histidine kinase
MRRKVVVSLVFLFAVFSTGAIVASWYVTGSTEDLQRLVELHEVEALRRHLAISVQTVQADLYTTHTELAPRMDAVLSDVNALDEAAEECASCHHRPDVADDLNEIRAMIERYKTAFSYYMTASANRERISQIRVEAVDIGTEILDRVEEMSEAASSGLEVVTAKVAARAKNVKTILIVTLALTFCFGIVMSWYLVRSVTGPVRRLVDATRAIASGRLGHRIEDEGEAEFGELARHFNAMGTALEASYEGLRSANADLEREISERMQAERERGELQSQLLHAQRMETLGTLSAGIAHEVNNPLCFIRSGFSELEALVKDLTDPALRQSLPRHVAERAAEAYEILAETQEGMDRIAGLVQELKSFAHGDRSERRRTPVDMRSVAEKAGGMARVGVAAGSIRIESKEIPKVFGSELELMQILLNLMVNAFQAAGGDCSIDVELRPADGGVSLSVRDRGPGIDESTASRLFEPFFTTKAPGAGLGLGLNLSLDLAHRHGGTLEAANHPEGGAVFRLWLPALEAEADGCDDG